MGTPSKTKATDLNEDLENWMGKLPEPLWSVPIINLAIPGSHDSMTWCITSKSPISPDAEGFLQDLKFLGPILRSIMARWAVTQNFSLTNQLKAGIRYFDLRLSTKTGTSELFFVHGLYAGNVTDALNEVNNFIKEHPKEVVILDCNHFYAFGDSDHQHLMTQLTKTFGTKLLPFSLSMSHLTLNYLINQFQHQVIAIYRNDAARFGQPLLWPSSSWPTPWPNTDSKSQLFADLNSGLAARSLLVGYISQCLLTPSTCFVARHLFGSLKSQCAVPIEKDKLTWIRKQTPGPELGSVNIIICDFVDLSDTSFCKTVIELNAKLLSES